MTQTTTILLQIQWGLKGLEELINIHPLFIHFPIALLLSSLAFYFFGNVLKKEEFLVAGKWTLYFGTLAATVAVWTGLEAAKTVSHGAGIHEMMMAHQYIGFAVVGLSLILSVWLFFSKANIPSKGRIFFLSCLLLLNAILIQGADLGGRMVFLNGVGVGRKSMLQKEADHSHEVHEHSGKEHADGEQNHH